MHRCRRGCAAIAGRHSVPLGCLRAARQPAVPQGTADSETAATIDRYFILGNRGSGTWERLGEDADDLVAVESDDDDDPGHGGVTYSQSNVRLCYVTRCS